MSIPESQLETWCNQGATVTSAAAYNSIQTGLAHERSKVRTLNPDIYLQGSYGNSTNVYADSDVDVVVQYDKVYDWDISALPFPQQALFHQTFQKVNYPWQEFHDLVSASLQSYFGASSVTQGNKALKVKLTSGRTVDVVPALLFRSFRSFLGANQQSYVQGIRFFDQAGRAVVNYPKEHIANGESKNGRTAARYKQTVRMFKNARTCAIERSLMSASCAPSYFVECALYNVTDGNFTANRQQTFQGVLNFLKTTIRTDKAVCQNEQTLLFGNTPEQWKIENAAEFVHGLDHLWNNW